MPSSRNLRPERYAKHPASIGRVLAHESHSWDDNGQESVAAQPSAANVFAETFGFVRMYHQLLSEKETGFHTNMTIAQCRQDMIDWEFKQQMMTK